MDQRSYYLLQLPAYAVVIMVVILVVILVIISYLIVQLQSQKSETQKLRASNHFFEKKLNNVQLEFIGTKLNPHLFKNILNSVQFHAYQTYISLEKLSNILDYILYESNNKFVSPREELNFTMNLIEINKIKINPLFDFRIKSKIDDHDAVYDEKVFAPLITVDLIENAFKHTDFLIDDAFISITIELDEGLFYMKVSNTASEKKVIPNEKGGFGSQSLDQRLKIIYENHYSLNRILLNGIYTAILKINLHEFHHKMRHSG